MDEFNDDPLDLLEDDGDGIIETILLAEEEEEQPLRHPSGCALMLCFMTISAGAGLFLMGRITS